MTCFDVNFVSDFTWQAKVLGEVLANDRKKLGVDSADIQNQSECRECL